MTDQKEKRSQLQTLVVEDDNLSLRLVESVLKTMHVVNIDLAENGAEALAKIKGRSTPYDLIISDCDMPVMDGMELVENIRKDYPTTTIVMLTARTNTKDFYDAKNLGVEYFFMKPITPTMLRMRLSAVLDVAAQNRDP